MNSRRIAPTSICLGITFALIANTAHATSETFIEALHEHHEATKDFQEQVMVSLRTIRTAMEKTPNVEALEDHDEAMSDSFEEVTDSFEMLQEAAEKGQETQQAILEEIEDGEFIEQVDKIDSMLESFHEFTDGIQQREFAVYAQEGWANSGLSVSKGDLITVKTKGKWAASPNYEATNQRGYLCEGTAYTLNSNYPLGALLYRVRGSQNRAGQMFNDDGKGRSDATGRLEFIMNDEDRDNNQGQLKLQITVVDASALKNLGESMQALDDS